MMRREHKYFPSMACLIDVCLGGKGFAAEGWRFTDSHDNGCVGDMMLMTMLALMEMLKRSQGLNEC